MKKRLLSLFCLILLVLSVLPVQAAADTIDLSRKCAMKLHYVREGVGFSDLEISVYRVAKAKADGTFSPTYPFNALPVNIYGITSQTEWNAVASTYKAFILADGVKPTRTGKTDASGTVVMENLQAGLYLVMGVTAENQTGVYEFNTFMIYVPTPLADGTFDYDVEAAPKCIHYVPKTEYSVVKLWKDTGYTDIRPKEVTVEIYKDGVQVETVKLNGDNNWTYSWHVPENQDGVWTVTEKNTPLNYTVTITESQGVFTVTNTRKTDPGLPPKTGDMFPLWPLVIIMCVSGTLLVALGIYYKRKNK